MTAVPLLFGVVADNFGDFNVSLPKNREPVPAKTGLSQGYLRPATGVRTIGAGLGLDRGGITWNDVCYRVSGTKLVKVGTDGVVTVIGDVGDGPQCRFDYGTDRLAIVSAPNAYYWDGINLTQITDPDLGSVYDVIWVDGYFLFTDGLYIIATDLNNPLSINPTRYGSAESDPDMITGLIKSNGEACALGLYSIEVEQNVGGNGFPFSRINGATITRGCINPNAKSLFGDSFAFVGSARNEAIGVHIAASGTSKKISTRRIDDALSSIADLSTISLETRSYRNEQRLYLHLPDRSFVFVPGTSQADQDLVWFEVESDGAYRPRNACLTNGQWIVGDVSSSLIGVLSDEVSSHFGENVEWRMDTVCLYNESKGAILRSVELVGLPGRGIGEGVAFVSFTRDGQTWSQERAISLGEPGQRQKRMQIRPNMMFRNWVGIRFRGKDKGMVSFAACNVEITPLSA